MHTSNHGDIGGQRMESKKVETRTKILSAASELFLEGGPSALSVRAISKAAGLSTIGIYSHFQGKQGILDALYIEGFELVGAATEVAIGGGANREKVLESCMGYLNVAEQHEAHYRLIFGEADAGYQPSEEALGARDAAFSKLVKVSSASLPSDATAKQKRELALDVWAIVHGYASISHHAKLASSFDWDWKKRAIQAVDMHLDGVWRNNA